MVRKGSVEAEPFSASTFLNPAQIQDKFALPNTPTGKVDATIPEGMTYRVGQAAGNTWGNGGGIQYEILPGQELNPVNYVNPVEIEPMPISPTAIIPIDPLEPLDPVEIPLLE